jgi:hypothetical protein
MKKPSRKPGELMLAVVEYVRKFPLVTNVELAAALGTSRENAGKA